MHERHGYTTLLLTTGNRAILSYVESHALENAAAETLNPTEKSVPVTMEKHH